MALENTAQRIKREAFELLPAIVAATTQTSEGYTFAAEEIVKRLEKEGFVEGNREIKNSEGFIAVRAVQAAIDFISQNTKKEEVKKGENKMSFEIESGVEIPKTARGGNKAAVYPFESLEVGQSFFVPATEKKPEPWKSLASTVSAAMKKHDVVVEGTKNVRNPKTGEVKTVPKTEHVKVYVLREATKDDVKGARVFRTK